MSGAELQRAELPFLDCPLDVASDPALLGLLGRDRPVLVPRTGDLPAAQCYANVAQLSATRGGQIVYGWMISWIPGLLVQAMHHAIWWTRDGKTVDPTAPQGNFRSREGRTTFIQDPMGEERLSDRRISNRHHLLAADPDAVEYLAAYYTHHGAFREMQIVGGAREDRQAPDQLRQLAAAEWDRLAPILHAAQSRLREVSRRLSARFPKP